MRKGSPGPPRAKKSLGQNFLVDPSYIGEIVAAVKPTAGETMIEIGPGRGAITEKLVASNASVIAIELDRDLIDPLRARFSVRNNFRVIEQDALTVNFGELLIDAEIVAKLVANLPYYISTAILQRLAEQRQLFSSLVLMFQREVVDRINAKPHSSERGYLTVLTEAAFEIEKLFDVPPNAFRPVPKVWSSVVRLIPKAKRPREEELQSLLSTAFAQKRKTISNNLKSVFPNYQSALDKAAIDPKARAEDLTLDDWLRLNDAILASR